VHLQDAVSTPVGYTIGTHITTAAPSLTAPASLPHFVVGGGFVMGFYAINTTPQAASFTLSFFDDNGRPATLSFSNLTTGSVLTDTVPPNGARYYEAGIYNGAYAQGTALITPSPVTVQALMRRHGSDGSYYEAADEPASGYSEFQIPFDATTFLPTGDQTLTGFSVANLDPVTAAAVTCTAKDSNGTTIPNAVSVPALNPLGHWAGANFAALTGLRGTLDCSSTTRIGAVAFRFIGTNGFSSLPVIVVR
jgi:hypothetical protein